MERTHQGSRKRANPPIVAPNERLCHYPYSGDHGWRGPKRHRPSLIEAAPPSNYLSLLASSSPQGSLDINFPNTDTETNTNINAFNIFPLLPPPGNPEGFPPFLSGDGQIYQHVDLEITQNAAGTSATYTLTDGTFSPRSVNQQVNLNTNDDTAQSPGDTNEPFLSSSDDFQFGLDDVWLWNTLNNNPPTFGDSASSHELQNMLEPMVDADSNTIPIMDSFSESPHGSAGSPFTPAAIYRYTACSDAPPWAHLRGLDNQNSNLNGELPHQEGIFDGVLQARVPQTSKLTPIRPSGKSSNTSSMLAWRHSTLGTMSPGTISTQPLRTNGPEILPNPKLGCRKGPLEQEVAEHAKELREVGACWRCRISKVRCSLGIPCDRCKKPSLPPKVCYRESFTDFMKILFPDLAYSHLSEAAIGNLIEENVIFTNNIIEVEMSSGPEYEKIHISVTEFQPRNEEFLALNFVATQHEKDGEYQRFIPSYAPPFGLRGASAKGLKNKCQDHIRSIIEKERHSGEAKRGDTSLISWNIFEAVNNYRKSNGCNNKRLLEKAVMLYATYYFMSRIITYTKDSAEKVVEGLRRPHKLNFAQTLTSTLLNLQIKQAMQGLLYSTAKSVLIELERIMSSPKTKAAWTDIFCTILVLCMCIEAVQVASDGHAMARLRKDPKCGLSRVDICRMLDEKPFKLLTEVFHILYKTPKSKRKSRVGFNPILDGLAVNQEEGITPQMVKLVNDVRQIIKDYGGEIDNRTAENPTFEPKPDLLTNHMVFRKRNSGRLVSKFLKSFM